MTQNEINDKLKELSAEMCKLFLESNQGFAGLIFYLPKEDGSSGDKPLFSIAMGALSEANKIVQFIEVMKGDGSKTIVDERDKIETVKLVPEKDSSIKVDPLMPLSVSKKEYVC